MGLDVLIFSSLSFFFFEVQIKNIPWKVLLQSNMRKRYPLLVNQPQYIAFSILVCTGFIKCTIVPVCRKKNKICVTRFIKAMDLLGKFPEKFWQYHVLLGHNFLTCKPMQAANTWKRFLILLWFYILFPFVLSLWLSHYNLKITSLTISFTKEFIFWDIYLMSLGYIKSWDSVSKESEYS